MTNFVAVGALIEVLCLSSGLRAQTPDSTAEARRKVLSYMENGTPSSLADFRKSCADGKEVGKVREDRAYGVHITPDASETCPLVIERQVNDGSALDYYGKLIADGRGNMTPQQVLKNTAAAAMGNEALVPIGNGRGYKLTSAIAWDAGEVVGSSDSSVTMQSLGLPPSSTANETKINQTAEACLDGKNPNPPTASACFTAGLVKAVMDRREVAHK